MFPALLVVAGAVYSVLSARADKDKPQHATPLTPSSSQLKDMSISPAEKEGTAEEMASAKHYLKVSLLSLGCATGGLLYSPLLMGSAVCLVYMSIPFWKSAYYVIRSEKRINMTILDSIVLPSYVLFHFYIPGSLAHFLYFYSRKTLLQTENHTRQSLINVFGEHPQTVWIVQDDVEIEIAFEKLGQDHVLVARAGEMIAADGIVLEGDGSVDQHILTGESRAVEKTVGDEVYASTVVLSGRLRIRVKHAGRDTVAAQIGDILLHTADYKSSIQSRGEQLADSSALSTLLLGGVALPVAGVSGAVAVLNASVGYNMRIFAPISILNYLRSASEHGILVKDGRSLDLLAEVDTVVFDKTGTLTLDQPHIGKIHCLSDAPENTLLQYAAAAEYKQSHPIAKAIWEAAQQAGLVIPTLADTDYEIGYGMQAVLSSGELILVGSLRFMRSKRVEISPQVEAIVDDIHRQGDSAVAISINGKLAGLLELHPSLRPGTKDLIDSLHQLGLEIYIISGDHADPTANLAQQLNIDHYFAETLPEDKAKHIESLQREGRKVCFVGDGINDAIALKKANVSVSMRGASSVATDTAQIVFMEPSLSKLVELFHLSRDMDKNLKQAFWISIVPGVICVGGVFFLGFGVLSSIVLFNLGMLAGGANALYPRFIAADAQTKTLHSGNSAKMPIKGRP